MVDDLSQAAAVVGTHDRKNKVQFYAFTFFLHSFRDFVVFVVAKDLHSQRDSAHR
jgi:hypothetical protein